MARPLKNFFVIDKAAQSVGDKVAVAAGDSPAKTRMAAGKGTTGQAQNCGKSDFMACIAAMTGGLVPLASAGRAAPALALEVGVVGLDASPRCRMSPRTGTSKLQHLDWAPAA
jgi:hypothetical protein